MIPAPSKRAFTHPLGLDALAFFCHPRHADFRQPVRHAEGICAANGYAAIRVTRGPLVHDDTVPAACPAFAEKFDALPWGMFDPVDTTPLPGYMSPPPQPVWRKLDDSRGTIYRGGTDALRPLWEKGRMTEKVPVMVAGSCAIPLAMLQLLARLPAAAVQMRTGDFLAIRFAGGEAIVPGRWRHAAPNLRPVPKFSLFLSAEQRDQLERRW